MCCSLIMWICLWYVRKKRVCLHRHHDCGEGRGAVKPGARFNKAGRGGVDSPLRPIPGRSLFYARCSNSSRAGDHFHKLYKTCDFDSSQNHTRCTVHDENSCSSRATHKTHIREARVGVKLNLIAENREAVCDRCSVPQLLDNLAEFAEQFERIQACVMTVAEGDAVGVIARQTHLIHFDRLQFRRGKEGEFHGISNFFRVFMPTGGTRARFS